ncbi:accessory gland protein Acp29AB-like [Drosophila takahashii]|uniref:accessory gland protein Acp29AB-like n=1 Tax=Drosophila takahashii TaxID=29030 RepID=UPI001CF91E4E|nr:accessory gland protein Acp29AB-like [Drosophila takahashii]
MLKLAFSIWCVLIILNVQESLTYAGSVALLEDSSNQCSQFCLTKLHPMIENIPKTETTLNRIYGEQQAIQNKLLEVQSKLETQQTGLKDLLLAVEKNLDDQKTSFLEETHCKHNVATMSPKFQKVASRYFYFENTLKLNRLAAGIACREMGGHLAVIKDEQEFFAITARTIKNTWYHVGINDLDTTARFISETTGTSAPFLKWSSGYPKPNTGCVYLYNYGMETYSCYDLSYFICQSDIAI